MGMALWLMPALSPFVHGSSWLDPAPAALIILSTETFLLQK